MIELAVIKLGTTSTSAPSPVEGKLNQIRQVNVRFKALLARINSLNSVAADAEVVSFYIEFKAICQTQDEQAAEIKVSVFIQNTEVKAELQEGINIRLQIARKLVELLRKINGSSARQQAAKILAETLVSAEKTIGSLGLKGQGDLSEITKEFLQTCSELGIVLNGSLYQQLLVIAGLEEKTTPAFGLTFALLDLFQKYDSSRQAWELIAELEKERKEMLAQAEEKKQEEKLVERRLEQKREDERVYEEKVKREKHETALAAKATEFRRNITTNYFDRIDAEVQHELITLELRRLQRQETSQALV